MAESDGTDTTATPATSWHRLAAFDHLDDGRVTTVTIGTRSLAVSRVGDRVGVLDNACPHQGGPLGEGTIEGGWLRCPWHGYDYSPFDGKPPEGFSDAPPCFATENRDGDVYVELPDEPTPERTVADLVVETLVEWGLTHVFGMVGHSNLGLADALRSAEGRGDLTYVAVRHEGGAAFAASAFGKLTGRPAGCLGIAGPGSTNLLTGLYDAKVDRAPVLALSGQVPSSVRGRGAFQDVDLSAAFADVARYSATFQAASNHAELASLAMKTAIVERDVAHLVFPDEVQVQAVGDAAAAGPVGRIPDERTAPSGEALRDALGVLAESSRPMIIVGHGARESMAEVVALAEHLGAPVGTTFKAKGLIADDHPLSCGVLGRSGTPVASWFMNESDAVIAIGASFSNHTGIADYKPIVQVDLDPMAIGRFHAVTVGLLGHAAVASSLLVGLIEARVDAADTARREVAERRGLWRSEKQSRQADTSETGLASAAVFAALTDAVDPHAVICVDVGNNTYSFGRYFEVSGNQDILMSGYLGSIGFAFPAVMGAWAAVGGARQVVGVSGDGGFGQYAMEFTTAVRHDMDITHVLLNNSELGKISKEQRAAHFDPWQTGLHNPNFAAFAELCGGVGIRVTDRDELNDAFDRGFNTKGPALIEIIADPLLI